MKSRLGVAGVFIVMAFACHKDPSVTPVVVPQTVYSLSNASAVSLGFKIKLVTGTTAVLAKDSTGVINPGDEIMIAKSQLSQDPGAVVKRIDIWNSQLKVKYKEILITQFTKTTDKYTWNVDMPHPNSSEITKCNVGVNIFMDQTSLFGFYPQKDYPRSTYFFNTSNYFKDLSKTLTPSAEPNAEFRLLNVPGTTLIGYDATGFAATTKFIKSTNGGSTWETLFDFGFSSNNDAFVATEFISATAGWLFNYNTVFNGIYANTYATDVYQYTGTFPVKVGSIPNYGVNYSRFVNSTTGYVLGTASNNVMPPDGSNVSIMKTTNGGASWSAPVLISNTDSARDLFRLDNGKLIVPVWASGQLAAFYWVSTDDGQTWRKETPSISKAICDIFFLPNGTGYLKTGTNVLWSQQNIGDVYKTTDGGTTWTKIKEQTNGSFIWFYDANTGYLQDLNYGVGQMLFVTRDGGTTWKEVIYPYDYIIK